MKTKSKRFLNLATLCLALLGTTLLMAHPVKAEGTWIRNEESSEPTNQAGQQGGTWGYRNPFGSSSESWGGTVESYDKGYDAGYLDGYKNGREGGQRPENPTPDSNPYDGNDKTFYKNGYSDGYGLGYEYGFSDHHPIQATLLWLWGMVSGFFGSLIDVQ
ncbi:TPA: hypothetical protein ACF1JQ_001075 [Streptococcus pyogenes]|uniref:hypothetical protein n=1 Tax=Streptococcus pyogenes TaxID=1314 RepID=UPI000DA3A41A|nr:hypothetical protein [Streptococcus pyogenes]HER4511936.1 hypothetical protein [Streptococcus pyogenes NGAS729]HER4517055.1 hypothetical protein [Streptococcus pyogenes NGAS732]HER4824221.1 hypothetical protein [Streptococcus pyogenes NGAS015]NSX76019.1 hypothetical protein [Streptococcus pyogenes]NTS70656.1 hypothetical protein [Streptococcus pyogenes]